MIEPPWLLLNLGKIDTGPLSKARLCQPPWSSCRLDSLRALGHRSLPQKVIALSPLSETAPRESVDPSALWFADHVVVTSSPQTKLRALPDNSFLQACFDRPGRGVALEKMT
jgi:hypothetical protein